VHRFLLELPVRQVYAGSAAEMLDAVMAEVEKGCHVLISAAAVADYTLDRQAEKIKSGQDLSLHLTPTPKIIKKVREAYPELKIVGFKAETDLGDEELIQRAEESMQCAHLDLMVANDVSRGGMGTDDNRVIIIDRQGRRTEAAGQKSLIAEAIIDALVEAL